MGGKIFAFALGALSPLALATALTITVSACVAPATEMLAAASAVTDSKPAPASPCAETACNLYWGDVHLHTNMSFDAYLQGTRMLSSQEAYDFAKGGAVRADNGQMVQLRKPLDFLGIADHAENMGLFARIDSLDPRIAGTPEGKRWTGLIADVGTIGLRQAFMKAIGEGGPMPDMPPELARSVWKDVAELADANNDPGTFTTLIGYEWTAMVTGDNLHRVVLYRDGAEQATKVMPFTTNESNDPEDLWDALARYEEAGATVLAIPHNGNLSNGRMFAPIRLNGEPIDAEYARKRARWERLFEVTQVKGDSETHPVLSPTDEFADFETWDDWNVAGTKPNTPENHQYEYARSGLLQGLKHEHEHGVNPFKFGLIGSSDIHTGLSTTDEDNFFGKFLGSEPSADRAMANMSGSREVNWQLGASGLTAAWAPANTREGIFDSLKRREVYGTTGTRIRLRFFGGWDYARGDEAQLEMAYAGGVPMGADLPERNTGKGAPTFLIHAARDPDGANLDRVQVVKGWIDHGELHEQVYDVALSDGRDPANPTPVGSTVNVEKATYTNTIGAPELRAWWRDPQFDPAESAFYYVRVLEIPTPRWTAYDRARYGTQLPEEVPLTLQERAYTSPIWYRP